MALELPQDSDPRERAKKLMKLKDNIEVDIREQLAILKTNGVTMDTPLVDHDGFPRADIDIYAVRPARVRVIELRNDLKAVMNEIGKVLEHVFDVTAAAPTQDAGEAEGALKLIPFAKVDAVAPSSPASDAGLLQEDLIVKFGGLTKRSFLSGSLQPLVQHVGSNENRSILIEVLRGDENKVVHLTPRKGWGGRGLIGCHIVPYNLDS
ncbi:proteasome 26S subunit [Coprinopsis sp. MPI-PUGE-AT-0042]|nr:proteasome 26S subunit [Coprinopsis sp. MPI-PUGE-AT-0042]